MTSSRIKKPAPVRAIAFSMIGLSILSVWFLFLWPACDAPRPEPEEPEPVEELRELRASVSDMMQAIDDLAEMNIRLSGENRALKSMLISCMKEKDGEKK